MISAKEVNERAAVARGRIAAEEIAQAAHLRKQAETAAAPAVAKMLSEIEKAIEKAIDVGAYGIRYSVDLLDGAADEATKTAYRSGLVSPLKEAGFDVGFRLDDGKSHDLSIRWEGA